MGKQWAQSTQSKKIMVQISGWIKNKVSDFPEIAKSGLRQRFHKPLFRWFESTSRDHMYNALVVQRTRRQFAELEIGCSNHPEGTIRLGGFYATNIQVF